MPELPEVEAARRAVEENCCGKTIIKAIVADDPKVIEGISASELQNALVGRKIIKARRKGKNMWLELDKPPFLSFQFGMTGAIYIKGVSVTKYKRSLVNDDDDWPSKFSKVFMQLEAGMEVSFTDKRRFARVRLLENPEAELPISELGPDVLLELMPEEDFVQALSNKTTAIKGLLLDQSFVAGIGNWVADEVLYHARIHPLQTASSLSKENCKSLRKCIKEVIKWAVEVDADSEHFPSEWIFHYRWGKRPGKVNDSSQYPENWIFHSREKKPGEAFVDGRRIDFIKAGGRTSAYVPELQKLAGMTHGKQSTKGGNKSSRKKAGVEVEKTENEQEEEEVEEARDEKGQGKKGRRPAKSAKAGMTAVSASTHKGKKTIAKASEQEKPKKMSGRKQANQLAASDQVDAKADEEEPMKRSQKMNRELENEKMTKQSKKMGRQPRKAFEKESAEKSGSKNSSGKSPDVIKDDTTNEGSLPDQISSEHESTKSSEISPDTSAKTKGKTNQGRKRKRGGKTH